MALGDGSGWDESNPQQSTLANTIDSYERDIRIGVRARMQNEHIWPASQTGTNQAGFHSFITFSTQTGAPSLVYGSTTQASSICALSTSGGATLVAINSAGNSAILMHPTYSGGGIIPTGGIIMWSGSVASIPKGWVICDGTNSTPDLRDKFVIGAGNTYAVAATGGASTVNLSHNHTGLTGIQSNIGAGSGFAVGAADKDHKHSISSDLSATQSILPPYYALCFIMKS